MALEAHLIFNDDPSIDQVRINEETKITVRVLQDGEPFEGVPVNIYRIISNLLGLFASGKTNEKGEYVAAVVFTDDFDKEKSPYYVDDPPKMITIGAELFNDGFPELNPVRSLTVLDEAEPEKPRRLGGFIAAAIVLLAAVSRRRR